MKKHELLKHAYDNYPKGTKFKNLTTGKENTSIGSFEVGTFGITTSKEIEGGKTLLCRYKDLEWAEIVNHKIAVKVENEKEFHALMKYYDGLGWNFIKGHKPLEYIPVSSYPFKVLFEDNFYICEGLNNYKVPDCYKEVLFQDFAKEHDIKFPIIKSEDGVWLYEGDTYFMFDYDKGISGRFDDFRGAGFKATSFPINGYKKQPVIFSDKKSALDWIESHKPKKIILEFGAYKFTVTKDKVNVCYGDSDTDIDLELINNALKELS